MKIKTLLFFVLVSLTSYAQNDTLLTQRYEVINAIFKDLNVERFGKTELDENFYVYPKLKELITNTEYIDNMFGHCVDWEKEELYAFSDVINANEISEMQLQINPSSTEKINPLMVSDKIKVVDDENNNKVAITRPLVFNEKAIVYITNKDNFEDLLVLLRINGEWTVRCRKNIYFRSDD